MRGIDGEVGLKDVQSLQQAVAEQHTDEGWLVSARRVSRAAREAMERAENRQLGCFTLDELLDQEADFSSYLDWLEAEIRRRQIDQKYVPLACTKEEFDPDSQRRIGVSRYDERDGWIEGYVDLWLDDPAKEHLSILGEFGTGKTWFALHYAWQALERYRAAQKRGVERPRLPLVIPLRDYAKAVSVESLFSEFFFRKHEIPIPGYSAFEQLNRMGKLLLIFDGFDEMAARVDRQQMINNFWELAKVVVPGAKVILTCRTEHFPEAQEGRALLNAELQASTKDLTGETPQFEVLELEKFDDVQIRQVLSLQTSPATVEQILTNPQLVDLASRPVMTELILEALPDIEAGKPVDMSRIYLYAVRRKMERDIKEERTFTSLAEKLYFLCELSWEMLSTDRMSINYREFPDRIRKLFGAAVQEEKDLDHWHYDMMGQTMLIRNADGDYMPAHRSLLEFFVAYKFAAELGAMAPDFLELAQMQSCLDTNAEPQDYTWSGYFRREIDQAGQSMAIPQLRIFIPEQLDTLQNTVGKEIVARAVSDLIISMLAPAKETCKRLLETIQATRGKTEKGNGYLGGNLATLAVNLDKSALEKQDLSEVNLWGANFVSANLRQTNLSKANLRNATFPQVFGAVFSVTFSPDGRLIVTGGADCEINLWTAEGGQLVSKYEGHTDWIRSIDFSKDGEVLASGSFDQTVKVWNLNTKNCFRTLQVGVGRVNSVAFGVDGSVLAVGGDSQDIEIWDIHTGKLIIKLDGHIGRVESVVISHDGEFLASGSSDQTIRLWHVKTGKCLRILEGHISAVRSVSFSPNTNLLASCSYDNTVRLWDSQTGVCLNTLEGHTKRLRSVTFSPDGCLLASCGFDQTIRLWNSQTGECLKVLEGHTDWIRSVSFSPDSKTLVSGSDDWTVKQWNIETGECLKTLQGYIDAVRCVALDSKTHILASCGEDSTIKFWNAQTGEYLRDLNGHTSRVNSIVFNNSGELLVSSGYDTTIRLWDVKSGKCLKIFQDHSRCVNSVAFSSDQRTLVTGSADMLIQLWDIDSGICLNTLRGHTDWVWVVLIAPDGKTVFSGSDDRTIKIWDLQTGKCLQTLSGHTGGVNTLAIIYNMLLISGSDDKSIKIWNTSTGECLQTLKGHTGGVISVAASIDEKFLISGSDDKSIKVWNISTGECLRTLNGHSSWVNSVAISSDMKNVVSGSGDQTIKVWDIEKGKCLKTLINRPYEGMNITGVKGLSEAEKATLRALGAVEDNHV